MGSEIYYLKEFVKEKKLIEDSNISQEDLEKYFIQNAKISYPTMRNYFYVLKMLGVLSYIKEKKVFKLNKMLLDSLRE